MTLSDLLTRRNLSHIQIGTLARVTLGKGWIAWIRPQPVGYTLSVKPDAGGERAATVVVDTASEAADLALTWTVDAHEGRFTVRCGDCRTITRVPTEHYCNERNTP